MLLNSKRSEILRFLKWFLILKKKKVIILNNNLERWLRDFLPNIYLGKLGTLEVGSVARQTGFFFKG